MAVCGVDALAAGHQELGLLLIDGLKLVGSCTVARGGSDGLTDGSLLHVVGVVREAAQRGPAHLEGVHALLSKLNPGQNSSKNIK